MTTTVGIVGAGISGLTLALRLQQLGVDATLYSSQTPDELRGGRLPNTVARFDHTLQRERALGVDHWRDRGHAFSSCDFTVGPPLGVRFHGVARASLEAVDFRVLLPRWVEDVAGRGGHVECGPLPAVDRLGRRHELVVVAVGRTSMASLFTVDPARTPYDRAQRLLLAALVDGLALPDPLALTFTVAPGVGEVFQMPMLTADGVGTNILVEAVPGGPLAEVVTRPLADAAFVPELVRALRTHAPAIADRIDPARFAVRSPRDALQGAVPPTVRHAFARLDDGTPALAVGDAWVTNDPVTGQGANVGSHCAFVVADAIAAGGPFDEAWGARTEAHMWAFAGPVTAWTNGFLQPPPPHVVELLTAAGRDQAVADAVVSGFASPVEFATALAEPSATATFIERSRRADLQPNLAHLVLRS
jgi:hypothetical protein